MSRRSHRSTLIGRRTPLQTITAFGATSPVDSGQTLTNGKPYALRAAINYGTEAVPVWGPWSGYTDSYIPTTTAATYYVSPTGSDAANGKTTGTAWQTVAKVNATTLNPGDAVYFEWGGSWSESLVIDNSGSETSYVIVGAYGSDVGNYPQFLGGTADGSRGTRTPITVIGSNVLVENIWARRSNFAGIDVFGNNVEIRWSKISKCPVGIQQDYSSADTYIHDCTIDDNSIIIVGPGPDDDGAGMGVLLHGARARVLNNDIINHNGLTVDYGPDGTVVEIYGAVEPEIAYNWTTGNVTFMEIGELHSRGGSVHHNVIFEPTRERYIAFNLQGDGWGVPYDWTFEHNTVYAKGGLQDATGTQGLIVNSVTTWAASTAFAVGKRIIPQTAAQNNRVYEVTVAGTTATTAPTWPTTTGATATSGGVTFVCLGQHCTSRNNIYDVTWKSGFTASVIDQDYDLFNGQAFNQIKSIAGGGTTSGSHSLLNQAPVYTSTVTPDLSLQTGSPGINAGINTGRYQTDYAGQPRLSGATVDMGAYENQTVVSGPPISLSYMESGGVTDAQLVLMVVGNVANATMKAVVSTDPTFATGRIFQSGTSTMSGGDDDLRTLTTAGTADNASDHIHNGWAAKATVAGLAANTLYYYGILSNAGDTTSAVNTITAADGLPQRVRTFPTNGVAASFSFGATSCSGWLNWDIDQSMLGITNYTNPALRFYIMDGDDGYPDAQLNGGASPPNPGIITDGYAREARRRMYFVGNPNIRGKRQHLQKFPRIYMPDDHEGSNDRTGAHASSPVVARVYREREPSYPLPAGETGTGHLGQTFKYGRTRVIMLDGRTNRSSNTATDDTSKTMLGASQKAWLFGVLDQCVTELAAGTTKFIYMDSPLRWSVGVAANSDGWGSFKNEQQQIVDKIGAVGLKNRMLIGSGDSHFAGYAGTVNSFGAIRSFVCGPINGVTPNGSPSGTWDVGPFATLPTQCAAVSVADPGGAGEPTVTVKFFNAFAAGGGATTGGTPGTGSARGPVEYAASPVSWTVS